MKKKRDKHKLIVNEKLMRLKQKNEFMTKFKNLFILISDEATYKMMPAAVLELIYEMRAVSIRLLPAEGHTIPRAIIVGGKKILTEYLKENTLKLSQTHTKEDISIYDYLTIGMTLVRFYNTVPENLFNRVPEIKQHLRIMELKGETHFEAMKILLGCMDTISNFHSDLSKSIYYIKFETLYNMDGRNGFFQLFNIISHTPDKIHVSMDNNVRPAFRVCWGVSEYNAHIEQSTLDAKHLGGAWTKSNRPFEVYIQSHALQRMHERLDNICISLLHGNLVSSLYSPVINRDSHGNLLLEYRLYGNKAGYLPIIFYDDKIVLTTFLFLTNKGTPEGDKLFSNTGLSIDDTKYLTIDKMSAFMSSDINTNDKVKQIFVDAGCESLFKMDKEMIMDPEKIKTRSISALIAEYLGLNAEEFDFEDWEEGESIQNPESSIQ